MRKMSNLEIGIIADRRYTKSIMGEGLLNGKKITLEVYRLFKKEATRRKGLEPKRKKAKAKKKGGPPII